MSSTVPEILEEMTATFQSRNKIYGDNYKTLSKIANVLFPNGVHLETEQDFLMWHLFELVMLKLTRFSASLFTHKDSIHDLAVYAAMVESVMKDTPKENE